MMLVACACGAPPTGEPGTPSDARRAPIEPRPVEAASPSTEAAEDGALCLPIVSGCGCAYQCAWSVHALADGTHQVAHDFLDSALVDATVERHCFDAAGHGSPARGAPADATRCLDVFYDGSACGGGCIASTEYLDCRSVDDRCAPSRR